jgi:GntR family transcriptional regulator
MNQLVKDPIYKQLNSVLLSLVSSGEYSQGQKFLTERQIGERFQVSRATANKAISNLVAGGVLEFRKGVGTFVKTRLMGYDLGALVSFTKKAEAAGFRPSTRILSFKRLLGADLEQDIKQKLKLKGRDAVYQIERLRMTDGIPVIFERRYLIEKYCPDLDRNDLRGSLYQLLSRKYGINISGADQSIMAVNIDKREAECLKVRKGTAGLLIRSTGFGDEYRPLWYEETLYRGDACSFKNNISGLMETSRDIQVSLIKPESDQANKN